MDNKYQNSTSPNNTVIYGFHSVTTYLERNKNKIIKIFIDKTRNDKRMQELLNLITQHQISVEYCDNNQLDLLANQQKHQGVVAQIHNLTITQLSLGELILQISNKANPLILILDGITDLHNLGAIIRSADCFGVDGIIIPKDNAGNPNSPVVAKVSSGAVYNLPIITVNNLNTAIDQLKDAEFWIAATALKPQSISLYEFKFTGKLAWVIGNEGRGIRPLIQKNSDYIVQIPMCGHTNSLNVSVATGIILSHTRFMQTI